MNELTYKFPEISVNSKHAGELVDPFVSFYFLFGDGAQVSKN